ncbi:uncharacterized protein LOC108735786 isoform X2 [Agrilus planipennis]|nr:uncharacterized protein LOC108735786 isoform X2 [Agrilus planipennis]
MLVSSELIADLMKTAHEILSPKSIRSIIERISQSSIMRMDDVSKQKLWDLITMVYKWQVNYSSDIIKLTHRHLYEIETFVTHPETHKQLHEVQKLIEDFERLLDPNYKNYLRRSIENWLKPCSVRVSLLLRLGLQNFDTTFVTKTQNEKAIRMFENLGESIYSIDEKGTSGTYDETEISELNNNDSGQLQMFVDQILNYDDQSSIQQRKSSLRLKINDVPGKTPYANTRTFENINVQIERNKNIDFVNSETQESSSDEKSFTEELLKIIEEGDENHDQ